MSTIVIGIVNDGSEGARQRPASMPVSQERPISKTSGSFTVMSTLSGRLMVRTLPKGTVKEQHPNADGGMGKDG